MSAAMRLLPDPLHPAAVHFPIVLVLLGAAVAVAALAWPRGQLPRWAAVLLVLGAAGAGIAYWSGEQGKELVGLLSPAAESLLDQHEDSAKFTLIAAIAAALLSVTGLVATRRPALAKTLRIATAAAGLTAAALVGLTGHRGGMMVYHHAVGVERPPATVASE
jgi:uncharacterized membrane protein